jgi:hypothetical protein
MLADFSSVHNLWQKTRQQAYEIQVLGNTPRGKKKTTLQRRKGVNLCSLMTIWKLKS